jgi:hypothetical protein
VKKRLGLVLIEVPLIASIIIRLFAGVVAYYYIGNVIEAIQSEEVVRRGNIYTMSDNPSSYFIRLSLYSLCAVAGFWYATLGTKVKNGN